MRTELQHRCDQVADLTKDHNALLTKFGQLTVLMSEAHNKLNTAVVQSGKAMAKDQSKVRSSMWLCDDTLAAEEVVCLCIGHVCRSGEMAQHSPSSQKSLCTQHRKVLLAIQHSMHS